MVAILFMLVLSDAFMHALLIQESFCTCCHSLHEIWRSSAPGWQQKRWTGKWRICRSCWTGNNLCELHKFLLLRTAIDLQDLQFYYSCRCIYASPGISELRLYSSTVIAGSFDMIYILYSYMFIVVIKHCFTLWMKLLNTLGGDMAFINLIHHDKPNITFLINK